jgi:hypothetical protein
MLVVRGPIEVGPWTGGLSVRSSEAFPRWNLVVAEDGSTRTFIEWQEGVMGKIVIETPAIEVLP